ncbi:MAG: extensin family protein [Myxococcales bacterium]|nr:extensin family protein [Myxococcales bacterium]
MRFGRLPAVLVVAFGFDVVSALAGAPRAWAGSGSDRDPSPAFPLDDVPRVIEASGPVRCPDVELEVYRGARIPFSKPARVNRDFAARLRLLEEVVAEIGERFSGRAPRRLVHLGTFNCRRIRRYPTFLSEHGLGNAIDVAGFDFGPLPRGARAPAELPRSLRRGFAVRIDPHWRATRGAGAVHAAFLRALADALIERDNLFRGIFGPAWPGHRNHFHLDAAPWRMVEVY